MEAHPSWFELLPSDGIVLPIDKISASFLFEDGLNRVIFWLADHNTGFLFLRARSGCFTRRV